MDDVWGATDGATAEYFSKAHLLWKSKKVTLFLRAVQNALPELAWKPRRPRWGQRCGTCHQEIHSRNLEMCFRCGGLFHFHSRRCVGKMGPGMMLCARCRS